MSVQHLALDSFWVDKYKYDDAESRHYEKLESDTPLADEVGRLRQRLLELRTSVENDIVAANDIKLPQTLSQKADSQSEPLSSQKAAQNKNIDICRNKMSSDFTCQEHINTDVSKFLEKKMTELLKLFEKLEIKVDELNSRLVTIENRLDSSKVDAGCQKPEVADACKKPEKMKVADDDDDIDLFGSDSDDEDAENRKKEVLAAYHAKKSKKPTIIAKSSIVLDVKPWDDETNMKDMEVEVRKIVMDGLLWGASKLVPLAFGIHKLQINCVVEDEKVSIDALQEEIEAMEDFVQSVDIAAFNKI